MEKHYLLAQTFIFISFQSVQLPFARYEANLRISSGSGVGLCLTGIVRQVPARSCSKDHPTVRSLEKIIRDSFINMACSKCPVCVGVGGGGVSSLEWTASPSLCYRSGGHAGNRLIHIAVLSHCTYRMMRQRQVQAAVNHGKAFGKSRITVVFIVG